MWFPPHVESCVQTSLSKFSPHTHTAAAQPGAQTAQANGPGQGGQQPAALDPGSVRLDPLGRPMSIDHEHQVSTSSWQSRRVPCRSVQYPHALLPQEFQVAFMGGLSRVMVCVRARGPTEPPFHFTTCPVIRQSPAVTIQQAPVTVCVPCCDGLLVFRRFWRPQQRAPMALACHVSSRAGWGLPAWRGLASISLWTLVAEATCLAASIHAQS